MDRGEIVWEGLNFWKKIYPKTEGGLGFEHPKVEEWIGSLSDEDFTAMLMLPIGYMSRVHYSKIRTRVRNATNKENI